MGYFNDKADKKNSKIFSNASADNTSPNKPAFIIVDPCLKDFIGHHYEYDHSTAAAASALGFDPVVLAHSDVSSEIEARVELRRCFSHDIWTSEPEAGTYDENVIACNKRFYRELKLGLNNLRLGPQSVIFGHMITERQLLGWAWFAESLPRHVGPKIVLLLRYQREFYEGAHCRQAFEILEHAAEGRSVRLTSDSSRLARQIEGLTMLSIDEVPIPHTAFPLESAMTSTQWKEGKRPLRCVSLGNARDEKGFLEILEAVTMLSRQPDAGQFHFVLQANNAAPDVQAAIDTFSALNLPNVELILNSMNSEDYYRLLLSSDVVLIPYWRSIYEGRTSGVCLEAIAAGKPVICTDDTWISDQFTGHDSALFCRDRDPFNLMQSLYKVRRNYVELLDVAQQARTDYVQKHNGAALVEAISHPLPLRKRPAHPPRIAVFYPWADILSGRSGASLRTNLLLQFLSEKSADVRVLQWGHEGGKRGGVRVEALPTAMSLDSNIGNAISSFCNKIGILTKGTEHLFWHLSTHNNRALHCRINEMVRWADVVMLEYTYWAPTVAEACRRHNVRFVLTDYDVVSDQVQPAPLRWLTRMLEFRGMRLADHSVAVAPADQSRFMRAGIPAALIPNPTDISIWDNSGEKDAIDILSKLYDISFTGQKLCIFVGSGFEPNRVAADLIRKFASDLEPASSDNKVLFVVAGACADEHRSSNMWALGKVDEFVLRSLYRLADIVLIPLLSGTGSSLKTIEALAAGKLVLGTKVAFRGLNVTEDRECIIEDQIDRYSSIILDLLSNPKKIHEIGKAGRVFAEQYDFRTVYRQYLTLLSLPLNLSESGRRNDASRDKDIIRQLSVRSIDRGETEFAERFVTQLIDIDPEDAEARLLFGKILTLREPPNSRALAEFEEAERLGYDRFAVCRERAAYFRACGQAEAADQEETLARRALIDTAQFDREARKLRETLWSLFHTANYSLVVACARDFLSSFPDRQNGDLHYLFALGLQTLGKEPETALHHYDRTLELGFDEYWTRFHRGRLKIATGDVAGGEIDLQIAAAIKPGDADLERELRAIRAQPLWALLTAGDHAGLVAKAREMLDRNYSFPEIHYLLALGLQSLGQEPQIALHHYDRTLELGFDEFWTRFHRGRLRAAMGDASGGEDDLKIAASIKPGDPDVERELRSIQTKPLWALLTAGDNVNLVAKAREILDQNDSLPEVHYLFALGLQSLGEEPELSLHHYNRTLEIGFDEFWTRYHRGRLRAAMGDSDGGKQDLEVAASIKPGDPNVEREMRSIRAQPLWALLASGDYASLVVKARETLEQNHSSPEIHYLVALGLHSLGQEFETALYHYGHALELGFDEFWTRYHRGRLRAVIGDSAGSKQDLEAAATIKPGDPNVERELQSIH